MQVNITTTPTTTTTALSYSIVWTPLPFLTWILPFIGHTGITNSKGIVSDFQGPYYVGDQGRMAFGAPTRVLKIHFQNHHPNDDPNNHNNNNHPIRNDMEDNEYHDNEQECYNSKQWDEAIQEANEVYRRRMHNLFFDNCHSHVAYALNRMSVKDYGVKKWNMVNIAYVMLVHGRFLTWGDMIQSWGPFFVILTFMTLIIFWNKGKL